MIYIKLSTNEYPRHIGDIQLDPLGMDDYAQVMWVDPPEIDIKTQRRFEKPPVCENGEWKMVWDIRSITQEEIDLMNNPPNI